MFGRLIPRLVASSVLALATLAAAPLPVPPIPPLHPPRDQIAPVPDTELAAPATADPWGPFSLRQFRVSRYDPSLGYAPGSRYQDSEDKRVIQTPGLTFKVPLQ